MCRKRTYAEYPLSDQGVQSQVTGQEQNGILLEASSINERVVTQGVDP